MPQSETSHASPVSGARALLHAALCVLDQVMQEATP
jgi:hypothetical protein